MAKMRLPIELDILIQEREGQGLERTNFADCLVIIGKAFRKDVIGLEFEVEAVFSDVSGFPADGDKLEMSWIQGSLLQVLRNGVPVYVIKAMKALDETEGFQVQTTSSNLFFLKPKDPQMCKLHLSDGDIYEAKIKSWGKKDGHTEVKVIDKPSVRGVHWKGGTTNQV